ncbi:hypothetical protein [Neisseria bacilliformis]|uniref:hypothetical protein n=1 Tax=Neisseria bacilliformis TaxID=267212 RepID=UPI0028E66447|nr:hypothetical protein [Neisseria bacilliformis]
MAKLQTRADAQSIQTSPVSHQEKTVTIPRALAEQAFTSLFDFIAFLKHADTIGMTARRLLETGDIQTARYQLELLASLAENVRPPEPHAYALWEAAEEADGEAA